ncbi:dCTP pyrophosphatase 1 [Eucalyptus grandis]|uniref:dCTP pyrophosphatase 1 n=1 Tax=Eucalyptus grandis TaxID=71139 RepID=UPI00192ECACE|nr:dCTP pyrophosphatase 1 [Eucalyptus grandis]
MIDVSPVKREERERERERENNGESKWSGVDLKKKQQGCLLLELRDRLAEFAAVRGWDKFHSPRNLLLALVGEVGELSEIFQWKGEVERGLPNWSSNDKEHLEEELSDVLLYLVRLADVCGLDLGQAALSKLIKNARKYPVVKP